MSTNRFVLKTIENEYNEYKVLGLTALATKQEIKQKFLELAAKYNPDTGSERNEEQYIRITEAYTRISRSTHKFHLITEKDPYKVFGLSRETSAQDIHAAWKRLRVLNFPDQPATLAEKEILEENCKIIAAMKDKLLIEFEERTLAKARQEAEKKSDGFVRPPGGASVKIEKEPEIKEPKSRLPKFDKSKFEQKTFNSSGDAISGLFSGLDSFKEGLDKVKKERIDYINNLIKANKKSSNDLISAIMNNHLIKDISQMIVKNRELLKSKDRAGNSLAHIACLANRPDVLSLLRAHRYDFNQKNNSGETPVLFLCSGAGDYPECLNELVKGGADLGESRSYRI